MELNSTVAPFELGRRASQGLLTVIKEIHRSAWDEGGIRLTEEAPLSMHTESSRARNHNYIAFISFIAGGATARSYNGVFRSRFACMFRNMVRRGSFGGGDWSFESFVRWNRSVTC